MTSSVKLTASADAFVLIFLLLWEPTQVHGQDGSSNRWSSSWKWSSNSPQAPVAPVISPSGTGSSWSRTWSSGGPVQGETVKQRDPAPGTTWFRSWSSNNHVAPQPHTSGSPLPHNAADGTELMGSRNQVMQDQVETRRPFVSSNLGANKQGPATLTAEKEIRAFEKELVDSGLTATVERASLLANPAVIIGFPRPLDGQGNGQPFVTGTQLAPNIGEPVGPFSPGEPLGPNGGLPLGHFASGEPVGSGQAAQFKEINLNEVLNAGPNGTGVDSGFRTVSGELIPRPIDKPSPPKSTVPDISQTADPSPPPTVETAPPALGHISPGEPLGGVQLSHFAPGQPVGSGQEAQFKEITLNEIPNAGPKGSGVDSGFRTVSGELIPRPIDQPTGNTPPKSTGLQDAV